MVRRYAFTMIELIFAIVIIAISVMSLPMVTQVISSNMQRGITQEAIFAASAELNQIIAYRWDENSLDPNSYLSRVAWGTDCNLTTKRRPGHIEQPYHRRCTDSNTTGPSIVLGLDAGENANTPNDLDDVDDSGTGGHPIFINYTSGSAANADGYKNDYNSTFSISYSTIDPVNYGTDNNNTKRINVSISNEEGVVTELTTFSSNIGEVDYYKRSY